ncbi:hypothetical protein Hanom_Chr10g00966681 [Helianthus anomalus]
MSNIPPQVEGGERPATWIVKPEIVEKEAVLASSHVSSATVSASALYSDSVEDRETVRCFRAFQEIKFEPK